jgi:hypothetical protein
MVAKWHFRPIGRVLFTYAHCFMSLRVVLINLVVLARRKALWFSRALYLSIAHMREVSPTFTSYCSLTAR